MWLTQEWDETPLIPLTVVIDPFFLNPEQHTIFFLPSPFFLYTCSYLLLTLTLSVAVFRKYLLLYSLMIIIPSFLIHSLCVSLPISLFGFYSISGFRLSSKYALTISHCPLPNLSFLVPSFFSLFLYSHSGLRILASILSIVPSSQRDHGDL